MKMETSSLLQNVYNHLYKNFPENWICMMSWEDSEKVKENVILGLNKIKEARQLIFINLSRFALGGKQYIEDYSVLDSISKWAFCDVVVDDNENYKATLEQMYSDFLLDVQDSVNLLRYHINMTIDLYSTCSAPKVYSAIKRLGSNKKRDNYVSLLEHVINICWFEYKFSFSNSFIEKLVFEEIRLKEFIDKVPDEEKNILIAARNKVLLMLCKLSEFNDEKEITYNLDFQNYSISWGDISNSLEEKFHNSFLYFIYPENISERDILDFQKDSWHDDVSMWKLVLLMRYYCKKTKNLIQNNKLIEINDKHYSESIKEEDNAINYYAARSVKNYMYNCRFSYLCQNKEDYTINELKKDINIIEAIQQETLINNYHPYQKAYEFIKRRLEMALDKTSPQKELEELLDMLKNYFGKFKKNVEWCRKNQHYIYQLRYKYCTVQWETIDVFCPSSYCRPLRFKDLDESVVSYNNEIRNLENRVKQNPDKIKLLSAHEEIKNIEKKNYELLSYFTTVVVFLVGMISIFIGNTSPMKDKMEYVIALGTILLLFVCLGYFIVVKRFDKFKPWIFGILGVVLIILLCIYYCNIVGK